MSESGAPMFQNRPLGGTSCNTYIAPKKGDPCQRCRERKSTLQFSDSGTLGLTHGFYQWWCDVCVLTEQLKYAREQAKRVADLERKLRNAKRRKREELTKG